MEVCVIPPPKHHYDVISTHCVSKLAYFIEHDIGYQPSKFQCSRMSGSNFMEGVMKFNERRRLIVNSVWLEIFVVSFFYWSIFGKYRLRLVRLKYCVFCKDR